VPKEQAKEEVALRQIEAESTAKKEKEIEQVTERMIENANATIENATAGSTLGAVMDGVEKSETSVGVDEVTAAA
jgi:hypothetical protein